MERRTLYPYLLLLPSMVIIFVILLLPLGFSLVCSLYKCDYMHFTRFVGLGNFIKVLNNAEYMSALARTGFISGVCLVFSLMLGTAFALWIHRRKGLFAYSIQITVLIPWVTSMVVSSLLWKWIFNADLGILNYLISLLGIDKVSFLNQPTSALWTLIFVMSWRTVGYAMVQILAGLKGISPAIEEAAMIDGANRWQLFHRVRLPMLTTPMLISSIVLTLSNINNLTVPLTLTGGGPGMSTAVITIPMYRLGFTYYQFGTASALSFILFVITFLLSVVYVKAVRYEV